MLKGKKIGIGITGSFCSIKGVPDILRELKKEGVELYPSVSEKVLEQDTRFAVAKEYIKEIEEICGREVFTTTVEAEQFGPKIQLDLMVILPITGTSIGKFANGINDTAPLLAGKATLRNNKPVLLGILTNDGLGLSGSNIMKLMATKNIFFVPFGQDDIVKKKNSLTCDFSRVIDSVRESIKYEQIQPVIIENFKK